MREKIWQMLREGHFQEREQRLEVGKCWGVCVGMSGWSTAAAAVESKAGGRNLTFVATGQSEVAEPSFPLSCPSDPSATPWGRQGHPAYFTEGDCNEPLLAVTSPV